MTPDEIDPKGLIREAYRIEGVSLEDCRGIFFDWVLGHRERRIGAAEVAALLDLYGGVAPDHPMTRVLREGKDSITTAPRRRGGARARR
ncbi:hypothetical protein BD830_103620 [Maritimibacter alkaliphilus HTCC2654]|uniref:Uncharacterized protein n=1 Tax=Maritimibacter alkaliphilus HTCC2654 TaxID=314271 RepID=A3VE05_9RHOB|nr:hypothetical protein [Maritimibacter alkaliphilus]EAQ13744.1 hypothetical protein RB2654_03484 [Maritimibacter alkaliphilus HTCC2654]TYP83580.1 hypothetical protein BD830_103620 [Maritimibacter alkaliphilus HTCC2654]